MRKGLPSLIFLGVIAMVCVCPPLGSVDANGRHKSQGVFNTEGKGRDHGNETTGLTAAWLFGVANLSVALSVLIKGINRFGPIGESKKNALVQFNRSQKKLLMPLHFYLNPVFLAIALTHWGLSHCRSTALPEWGIGLMITLVLLGLMLKFKLCPRDFLKHAYRLHSHPLPLITLILLLIIGHSMMD